MSSSEIQLIAHLRLFSSILKGLTQLGDGRKGVKAALAVLLKVTGPELDFEEVVDEILFQCKQLLEVDRVGLYLVDKVLSTMLLFVSQNVSSMSRASSRVGPATGSSVNAAKRSTGVRMPLKGIAAHVALHGIPLNIPDAYANKHFDPAMDLRTGYRTRQMLCIPIFDNIGNVIGVIQFINPLDGRHFSSSDIMLAELISRTVSTKANLIKLRSTLNSYKLLNKSTEKFRLQVLSAITDKPHRHLQLAASLFVGKQQYGPTQRSELYPTVPFASPSTAESSGSLQTDEAKNATSAGVSLTRCDFNTHMSFTQHAAAVVADGRVAGDVDLNSLPQCGRLIIELFSKNNHPVCWTFVNIFEYNRSLQSGAVELVLLSGPRPVDLTNVVAACGGLQRSHVENSELLSLREAPQNILSVAFPSFETVNVVHDYDVSARYFSILSYQQSFEPKLQSASTFNTREWYLSHMTPAEKKRYFAIMEQYAAQVMNAGEEVDSEAAQLLWRMRAALSAECPWALSLFLLSVDWLNPDVVEETYKLL